MKKYIKVTIVVTVISFIISVVAAKSVSKNDLLKLGKNYIKDAKIIDEKDLVENEIVKIIPYADFQKLKLNLVGGDARVVGYDGSDVRLKLKLKTDSSEVFNIDNYLEKTENELKINLVKSANEEDLNVKIFSFGSSSIQWMDSLDLVIEVPHNLKQLKINAVTSDLNLENLDSEDVSLNSVSGDIYVDTSVFKNMNMNTVSGDIKFKVFENEKYQFKFNSMSGDILGSELLSGPSDRQMSIETISGDVEIY